MINKYIGKFLDRFKKEYELNTEFDLENSGNLGEAHLYDPRFQEIPIQPIEKLSISKRNNLYDKLGELC